jgi:hypothetical protein
MRLILDATIIFIFTIAFMAATHFLLPAAVEQQLTERSTMTTRK